MIPSYERSKVAVLNATFSLNDVPADPTDIQATIYYKGTVKVAASTPVRVSVGHYYKEISIAADWDLDYYAVIWTGALGSISFKKVETFKVIREASLDDVTVPSTAYCTVNDVLMELSGTDYTTLPDYTDFIASRIIYGETRVHNRINRTFKRTTTASYFDGNGLNEFLLPYIPIYSLDSMSLRITPNIDWWTPQAIVYINCVDMRGNSVRTPSTDAEVKASDLIVDCVSGILTIPERILYMDQMATPFWNYTFLPGSKNVRVAWTYGYDADTIPDDIRLLCAKMVAKDFLLALGDRLSGGAVGLNTDGFSRSYQGIPFAGRITMLDKDIDETITHYKLVGVG